MVFFEGERKERLVTFERRIEDGHGSGLVSFEGDGPKVRGFRFDDGTDNGTPTLPFAEVWCPQGDSNPCCRRERAVS
jgi:hypothetical protein